MLGEQMPGRPRPPEATELANLLARDAGLLTREEAAALLQRLKATVEGRR